jgi:hypothetical protein
MDETGLVIENVRRGDTLRRTFIFIDKVTKLRIPIQDKLFQWTFKTNKSLDDEHPSVIKLVVDLSQPDPLGIKYHDLNSALGKVTLRLSPELTKKFTEVEYFWDLQEVIPLYDGEDLKDHDVISHLSGVCYPVLDVTKNYSQGTLVP